MAMGGGADRKNKFPKTSLALLERRKMTVNEILIEWLKEHGYSGLWNEEECGCPIDDLILCDGEGIEECHPGYKVKTDSETTDSGFNWKIVSEKPEEV